MANKKVLIIGAGMTGLALGCYLQGNGYDTEIYELHNVPGGLCTSWKRNGYTFDGCIHWLCGSSPKTEMYTFWRELADIDNKQIVNHDIFYQTNLGGGKKFTLYTDSNKLREEMLKFAPEDEALINEFIKSIESLKKADPPVLSDKVSFSFKQGFSVLKKSWPFLRAYMKWKNISLNQYQGKFKNPFFRKNFIKLFGIYGDMPVFALVYTLALMANKDAGYPIGGSLEFAKSFEKKYLSLGGKVNYNSRVEKIITDDGKAMGLKFGNGTEHFGDLIVSAADGHYTIYNLLEGKYIDNEIEDYYKNLKVFPPLIQVSLGIARDFKEFPNALGYNIQVEELIYIDPTHSLDHLGLKIYNFDPTLAPAGKTSVVMMLEADYEYWTELKKNDPSKYSAEKERIAEEIIDRLEKYYGNIKENVEVYDVATPYTYARYTNNWKASFEGFIPTVDIFGKKLKTTLPGLNNFYMIGQWVQPGGGLPTSAMMGRHLAQKICREDGKSFKGL